MFFQKRSVETIIAPITKIVDQLKDHAAENDTLAGIHRSQAQVHTMKAQEAITESSRAAAAAEKVSSLVG